MLSTFVYVATGENFNEVVYPMSKVHPMYTAYFIFYTIGGMFFVLSMVIASFQNEFRASREHNERKQLLLSRAGMVAAFVILDLDSSGALDMQELLHFFHALKPRMRNLNSAYIEGFFSSLDQNDDNKIDIQEFVLGIEDNSWEGLIQELSIHKDAHRLTNVREKLKEFLFDRNWYDSLTIMLVCCNLWAVAMYGNLSTEYYLDYTCVAFSWIFVIEMMLKVWAFGVNEYFYHASYHSGHESKLQEKSNWLDFGIVTFSFFAISFTNIALGSFDFLEYPSARMVLTLPLLRLFPLVKKTRELVCEIDFQLVFHNTDRRLIFLSPFLSLFLVFFFLLVSNPRQYSPPVYSSTSPFCLSVCSVSPGFHSDLHPPSVWVGLVSLVGGRLCLRGMGCLVLR